MTSKQAQTNIPAIQFRIRRYREIDSTNTRAHKLAQAGEAEGTVLVTDYQTAGHGKRGRSWVSPSGKNLLFSLILRPRMVPAQAPILTQMACLSVAKAIAKKTGVSCEFKRPNDLLFEGKKLCGVLAEMTSRGTRDIEYAILGVGLNVNASIAELVEGATSLFEITGRMWSLESLLNTILATIGSDLECLSDYTD